MIAIGLPRATVDGVITHKQEDKKALGRRLAALRELRGWKQDYVAGELGVTKAAVSAWEGGRNLPDALMLKRIAMLFGVSVDAVLWENSLTTDAMQFAATFDALTDRQRRTLQTVLLAFVQEAAPDAKVESAYKTPPVLSPGDRRSGEHGDTLERRRATDHGTHEKDRE